MSIVERILSGEIQGVFIDSRKPIKDGLFVPIIGEKFNGNSYIIDAFEGGAKTSLVQKEYYEQNPNQFEGRDVYIVDDTLEALQFLASEYRDSLSIPVVGITGSNGKTTTKNMLKCMVETTYKTYATLGNFNNEIGMPLSILNVPRDTEVIILEMGMSGPGEISELVAIAKPTIGIITNIGESHMEFFEDKMELLKAKMEISERMTKADSLILNGEDEYLNRIESDDFNLYRTDEVRLTDIQNNHGYYRFNYQGEQVELRVPGGHNVINIKLAIRAAEILGITPQLIKQGIENYTGESMRLEKIEVGGVTIINDAYNSSPASMKAALKTLIQMDGERKLAVIGDMYELGEKSEQWHREVGESVEAKSLDMIFTVGEDSEYIIKDQPLKSAKHFRQLNKLNQELLRVLRPGDILLVKASRGMELDRVVSFLMENYHG